MLASKDALRRGILRRRGELTDEQWRLEDTARTRWLLRALGPSPATVALYASRNAEPGTTEAVTALHAAGWEVLLPRLGRLPDWAAFDGWSRMRPGWGAIPEPASAGLGADALARADVVVVACLAVARDGTRLGTGGGWYDRALPWRRPGAPVWALARDPELLAGAPREPHDVGVDQVITPGGVFACGEAPLLDIGKPWPAELS